MADVIFPTGIPDGTPATDDRILFSDTSATNATKDCAISALPISDATQSALNSKQDTLVAGTNISIVGTTISATGTGTGDVVGPASATDNAVVRFDGTTGKLIQNSSVTISDTTGDITAGKYNTVTISGSSTPTLAVTGTTAVSGTNTGDQTTIAAVTVANEAADATCFPAFFTAATGDLGPKTNAGLTFDSSTATLSSTVLTGTTRVNTPELMATGAGGIDFHNHLGQQVAIFGAGGSQGSSLNGPTNIGSGSADYTQIVGGTGTVTQTATGSSTDISINLVPKGTGTLKSGGTNVLLSGGALGTPSSGTLTNCSGLPAAGYATMVGDSGAGGTKGAVPAPAAGDAAAGKFLKADGTWTTVSGGSGDVTGPASSTDNAVVRFDGTTGKLIQNSAVTIADTSGDITGGKYNTVSISGASTPALTVTGTTSVSGTNTGDQNLFSTIAVSGQSNVVADSTTDTLTLVAGTNVTITTDASTDSITINSTGGSTPPPFFLPYKTTQAVYTRFSDTPNRMVDNSSNNVNLRCDDLAVYRQGTAQTIAKTTINANLSTHLGSIIVGGYAYIYYADVTPANWYIYRALLTADWTSAGSWTQITISGGLVGSETGWRLIGYDGTNFIFEKNTVTTDRIDRYSLSGTTFTHVDYITCSGADTANGIRGSANTDGMMLGTGTTTIRLYNYSGTAQDFSLANAVNGGVGTFATTKGFYRTNHALDSGAADIIGSILIYSSVYN